MGLNLKWIDFDLDNGGRISVSTAPLIPKNAVSAVLLYYDNVKTFKDVIYQIPQGKVLYINSLLSGSQVLKNGSAVELWFDPTGDGKSMEIITVINSYGNTTKLDLNESFTGSSKAKIRMRFKRLGTGTGVIFGKMEGYIVDEIPV